MTIPWFDAFGVDEPLIQAALAMATAHGADDAELYFQHSSSTSLSMSDRLLHEAHTSIDVGVGVRVVVGDQVGYAWTEDLSRDAVLRAAATASEIARTATRPVPPIAVASRHPLPQHYPLQRSWGDVELAERLPLVRRWEAPRSPPIRSYARSKSPSPTARAACSSRAPTGAASMTTVR
jgi:TldD protein